MRRHLVAVDGTEKADFAFDWYLDNIHRPGDEVVVCHCSQFVLTVGLPGAAVHVDNVCRKVQEAVARTQEISARASERLKSKGIKFMMVIKSGMKPADAILQTAADEKVSHIIMGTRGLGALQRTFLGSVSSAVLSGTKVPVTVVKSAPDLD